jgi:hypothetical protein
MTNNTTSVGPSAQLPSRAERARARWLARTSPPPPAPPLVPTRTADSHKTNITILYVLVVFSLLLNAGLVWLLARTQSNVHGTIQHLRILAQEIEKDVLLIPVHVDETFPLSVQMPFEYNNTFPVSTTAPISTTLVMPFDIMGSTIEIEVPVAVSVPIDMDVPMSVARTFEISTTVPVEFDMDVQVRIADTPIPAYLSDLTTLLLRIKAGP